MVCESWGRWVTLRTWRPHTPCQLKQRGWTTHLRERGLVVKDCYLQWRCRRKSTEKFSACRSHSSLSNVSKSSNPADNDGKTLHAIRTFTAAVFYSRLSLKSSRSERGPPTRLRNYSPLRGTGRRQKKRSEFRTNQFVGDAVKSHRRAVLFRKTALKYT